MNASEIILIQKNTPNIIFLDLLILQEQNLLLLGKFAHCTPNGIYSP